MTDTSIFNPESQFGGSAFDVSQTDRNLRQISTVERTWGLPPLPDEVKFDLATQQGADEDGLSSFLTGLEQDLNYKDQSEPELLTKPTTPFQLAGMDQARIILAGVAGAPAPELPSMDAVRLLKQRAVDEGYIDPNALDPSDPTWSPEMNGIRGEMVFDDYNSRQLGDRPGAAPLKGVMGILNDFTSPSGLLSAATQLDLFWDVGAIEREVTSWGDKWREVGHSKNPLDFAGNLIDALTGPIDDIVLPALNLALLATGVGAVANTARIGWMGARIATGGRLLEGLYSSGRALQNWKALGEASWTAQKLMGSTSEAAQTVGRGLQAWREALAVRGTRAVMQPVMRLGFAHEAEERMGMYKGGGASLSDIPGVAGVAQRVKAFGANPLSLPFEMMLAPYNIWVPGTFLRSGGSGPNILSTAGKFAAGALGTIPGRAAAGGLIGVGAGTLAGEDAGDVAKGGLIGAGVGAALPAVGKALQAPVVRAAAGAAAGAGMGALLGDDPEDIAFGAMAGLGLIYRPQSLRNWLPKAGATLVDRTLTNIGTGLSYLSFKPIAEDQRVSVAFHRGMQARLVDSPDKLEEWNRAVQENGVIGALAKTSGVDDESAAATIGFTLTTAAIDHTAKAQSMFVGGSDDTYHMFRNKLTSQLRSFDLSDPSPQTLNEFALARSFAESTNLRNVRKAFRRIRAQIEADPGAALELAARHNELAHDTIRQLISAENMPDLADNVLGEFGKLDDMERASVMETYMPQIGDTFGNWPAFSEATAQIRQATVDGHLAAMTIAPAKNRRGNWIVPKGLDIAGVQASNPVVSATNRAFTDLLLGPNIDFGKARRLGRFTPLATALSPGRPTVMLQESLDWGQLVEETDRLADIVDAGKHMRTLPADPKTLLARAQAKQSGLAAAAPVDLSTSVDTWTKGQVKNLLAMMPSTDKSKYKYLLDFAKRKGLTVDEIGLEVNRLSDEVLNDGGFWNRVGLQPTARQVTELKDGRKQVKVLTGLDALEAKVKELDRKAHYTAKRIDTEQLVEYHRSQGDDIAAQAVQDMADGLESRGYKLVHGVEFLMPEDLAHGPIFADVTARHLNAATFGNFFKGRLPIEAHAIEDRRQRLALASELSRGAGHVLPDSDAVNWALEDLHALIRSQHDRVEQMMVDLHNQTLLDRTINRVRSSFTPVRLDDLSAKKTQVVEFLKARGYDEEKALAVWRASNKFRNTSFKDLGLYSLEAKLRSSNQISWALKTASGSKHFEGLGDVSKGRALWESGKGKRYIGAVAGAAYGRNQAGEDATFEERLGAAVLGGVGGAAVASVVPRAIGAMGVDKAARMADNWRFGYMADGLARLRDSMRFTLSPFFDLSRYTEGMMLAQTAAPLRKADGTRLALPLDMSPKGLRRTLRNEMRKAGDTGDVSGKAWGQYERYLKEFNAAAAGDYDPETLDSVGRWFQQIGIMGFSPTDWMSTAFAHLRRQGIGAEQSYKAARGMYTYGTRGRSAAELSVNFIFFPFSFQKKALGHIAHWMHDDLSRSLMIHDALKTYEILDEKFNLDEYWREHVPMLRQLQKLNLFAYGISPGRFGGINRQLFESAGKVGWNLFVPAGMEIRDASAGKELQSVMRSLTPAINDVDWMVQNLKETGHVIFSQDHVTSSAEARKGYEAWNRFKEDFDSELKQQGFSFNQLDEPWLADAKQYYDAKKAEYADRYPAWQKSKTESISEIQSLAMERSLRIDRVARAGMGGPPASIDDYMLAQFDDYLTLTKQQMGLLGFTNLEDAPPEIYNEIRQTALDYLDENPGFRALWEKFYRRELGPISVPATSGYLNQLGADVL